MLPTNASPPHTFSRIIHTVSSIVWTGAKSNISAIEFSPQFFLGGGAVTTIPMYTIFLKKECRCARGHLHPHLTFLDKSDHNTMEPATSELSSLQALDNDVGDGGVDYGFPVNLSFVQDNRRRRICIAIGCDKQATKNRKSNLLCKSHHMKYVDHEEKSANSLELAIVAVVDNEVVLEEGDDDDDNNNNNNNNTINNNDDNKQILRELEGKVQEQESTIKELEVTIKRLQQQLGTIVSNAAATVEAANADAVSDNVFLEDGNNNNNRSNNNDDNEQSLETVEEATNAPTSNDRDIDNDDNNKGEEETGTVDDVSILFNDFDWHLYCSHLLLTLLSPFL